MRTNITGRHMEISPTLRSWIEERVAKLAHFADRIEDTHVVVDKEGRGFRAEVTMLVHHHTLVASETGMEPRPAVDAAVEKVERQLRDLREKLTDRKGRAPARGDASAATDAADAAGAPEPIG